jgi:tagatose 6-phosphate kinase
MARKCGVRVVLDLQGTQLMRAVRERPTLVKINRAELAAATGKGGIAKLMKLGAEFVVITHGAKPVMAFKGRERWRVRPPRVKAVNPIGSGDAMLAGMVVGLDTQQPLDEVVRIGVACGAANALTETSGVVSPWEVMRLLVRC